MVANLGDRVAGSVFNILFWTTDQNAQPSTPSVAPSVMVYKNGSTTESSVGVTVTSPFDSRAGLNLVAVDTSADGSFYAAGNDFTVVMVSATVDGLNTVDILGFFSLQNRPVQAFAAGAIQSIWDALTSALSTANSIGKLIVDNLNATITSRLASGTVASDVTAIKAKTDNLPAAPAATGDVTTVGTAVAAVSTKLGTPAGASVSADIAAVKAVDDAIKLKTDLIPAVPASQGDVTTVGTSVTAVSTKLGTPAGASVSADIATKLATSGYTAPDNASITAIKAKTDLIPAVPASQTDVTTVGTAVAAVSTKLGTPAGASIAADIATRMPSDQQITVKKNTALSNFEFPMYDSSGVPTAGLTVTATRSIDGGAFAACSNAAAGVSNGMYKINLSAADLNGGVITFKMTATGASPTLFTVVTQL